MEAVIALLILLGLLAAVVEKICEFVFQIVKNLGVKPEAWAGWKPILVMILSVAGCMSLKIALVTAYFPALDLPYTWVDPLFTGILVGGGADILHLLKNLGNPTVKA